MFEPYLYTLLWAMAPVLELRAALPLAYLRFGVPLGEAIVISVMGNLFAGAMVLLLLPTIVRFFERHIPVFHTIIQSIFNFTRNRHSHRMEVVGEVVLIFFVAVPLPGSGAWTGALVSYLFGIRYRKAVFLIFIGLLLSAGIVTLFTLTGNSLWEFFNGSSRVVTP
ncbi:small multi-drug export protein [Candidatus Gracilibacteria bacterium]|nr:small multi-drug export protein [Candidatus Gracilibacteria bacterium]MCF7819637.1 small multi-drug export protein [Candidatus Gracilibacteria bacterium]